MRIVLAPMEGVVDHTMREMLTAIGGIDRCVTEFVRVTDQELPDKIFYRLCPELHHHSKTLYDTPVYVQLLGGHPETIALNAQKAARLGAAGIDLNFGCPSKKVNNSDGGSVILREPTRVYDIINAARNAVPSTTPVTAKIRLGYEDSSQLADIADAVFAANASELAIHARTKVDGYKPPAHWHKIADIKQRSPIPIFANGEIWTPEQAKQCQQESGCTDIMIGRGLLSRPDLARQIKNPEAAAMSWKEVLTLLLKFCHTTEAQCEAKYVGNRVKQWLGYLRLHYQDASALFEEIKRLKTPDAIEAIIQQHQAKIIQTTKA
ncbi:tRNA-dihydrouridine synthase [bacterium]|nr:tRNA-dihydrouridine synthase [bacterium]